MIYKESEPETPEMSRFVPFTRIERWSVVAVVAVTVILRFVSRSPLWLDEALSVHIAELPVGDLLDALRHDGHPPLYYLLLHGWMSVFGDGDLAVRALSGLASVATLPLAYVAGRRRGGPTVGGAVLLLVAVTPFSLRYATETRMYALVTLLVFVAWLLADDLRSRRDPVRWAGLAVVTGLLLLSHYWAFYLGAAAVVVLAWHWWRHGARDRALRIGSALATGCLLFLPWAGSFLYQLTHTGTPWASAARPTSAIVELAAGIGEGGARDEALLYGVLFLLLAGIGATAVATRDGARLSLDLRTTSPVRPEVVLAVATLVIGVVVGLVTDATFVARYAAVFLPFLFVAAGRGLAGLPVPWPRAVVGAGLLILAGIGLGLNVVEDRTQGAEHADVVNRLGEPGDVVAFCPDQLGPSTVRALADGVDAVGVPTLESAARVDWVDYEDRNRSADASAVAAELHDRAGDGTVWLVVRPGYRTYEGLCEEVQVVLGVLRPGGQVRTPARDVFEPSSLLEFPAPYVTPGTEVGGPMRVARGPRR